ncbi:MAG: ankyrin repeat domain-containing protein [Treponema sp.]|nr:ankyrin repeat domain-containing protein [Treponema sp.]
MKWLIFAPDMQDKNLSLAENFLDSQNAEYVEVFLSQDSKIESLSRDVHTGMSVSHCIIVDSQKMAESPDYAYFLGLLLGGKIMTFIHTGGQYDKRYEKIQVEGQTFFRCFDDINNLIKYITNNYALYEVEERQLSSLQRLLTLGIPFTSDMFAHYIAKDKTEICQLFLDAGMIPSAFNEEGVPMLCIAARNECVDKVKWLLENGADINAVSHDRGYTPVMDAVWRKNFEITEYLIEAGADLSVVSSDGQPILVLAVGNGDYKIVDLLLKNGANPDLQDSMGMSARGYANLFKKNGIDRLMEKYPPKA